MLSEYELFTFTENLIIAEKQELFWEKQCEYSDFFSEF